MNRVNPPSSVLRVAAGVASWIRGRRSYVEITAPAAERLSLNASNCCFIKRKRNRFSDAERNREVNTAPANWAVCQCISRDFPPPPLQFAGLRDSRGYLGKLVSYKSANTLAESFTVDKTDYETTSRMADNSLCCRVYPSRREWDREWFRNHRDELCRLSRSREVGNIRLECTLPAVETFVEM